MKTVLFVCMGNICRSPAGEGIFHHIVEKNNKTQDYEIDSAGTIGYHTGEPADKRMRTAAKKRGYELLSKARQFKVQDFENFDVIIAMDRANFRDITNLDPEGKYADKVKLMLSYHPNDISDVPDPYYGGDGGFENVLDLLEVACQNLFDEMESG